MKLQSQVNPALTKSPQARRYENAAVNRYGSSATANNHEAIFKEIFNKPQHYPVYKVPQRNDILRPTNTTQFEKHFEDQPREPLQTQKMQEAIQVYRKVSKFNSTPPLDYNTFVQTLVTGKPLITGMPSSEQVLSEYKRKREEAQRIHQENLWDKFDVKHMIYVDDPKLSMGMRSTRAGVFLNLMV